jgi:hypothetical protein
VFNLFKRERKLEIIRVESSRVRLHEFRSDKGLVGVAQKVLADSNVRLMLDVLRNESPANWGLPQTFTSEQRAAVQAMIQGYQMAINNLEAMAAFKKPVELEQPDFAPEEPPNI